MYFLIISLCRRLRAAPSSFDRAEVTRSSFAEGASSTSGAVSTATGSRRRAPPPALKCPGGCSATAQVVQSGRPLLQRPSLQHRAPRPPVQVGAGVGAGVQQILPNAPLVCEQRRQQIAPQRCQQIVPNAPLVCEQLRLPSIEA